MLLSERVSRNLLKMRLETEDKGSGEAAGLGTKATVDYLGGKSELPKSKKYLKTQDDLTGEPGDSDKAKDLMKARIDVSSNVEEDEKTKHNYEGGVPVK